MRKLWASEVGAAPPPIFLSLVLNAVFLPEMLMSSAVGERPGEATAVTPVCAQDTGRHRHSSCGRGEALRESFLSGVTRDLRREGLSRS